MILRDYIKHLQNLEAAGHGGDVVVYGIDEEGNSFMPVCYTPSMGKYSHNDRQYIALSGNADDDAEYQEELDMLDNPIDAVCVN